MSIFLGLLATSLGFIVTVAAVNVAGSAVGLFDFDPSYKSGIEREHPLLAIGCSALALCGAAACAAALGALKWFLFGAMVFPMMMLGALIYFRVFERN